jgi:hypothetical protein
MSTTAPKRIPLCDGDDNIIERIDGARARRMALAPNATVVRKRKGGEIVRILLASTADDSLEDAMYGNPRAMSHNRETATNPEKVWTLKRIPDSTADLFRAVVLDAKRAA